MKKYVIIGGSTGIGLSIVQKMANEGHHVTVLSRQVRTLASMPNVTHHTIDIAVEKPNFPVFDGALDGLVYCPGTINLKPFNRLKAKDFLSDFNINVLGAAKTIQYFLPNLKLSQYASVVLFSTVAVQTGMPFHASIAAAKGAIEGLTRSLAAELSPKIRVNAIAPSLTATPLSIKLLNTENKVQSAEKRHPLKRIGSVDDMAAATSFLLNSNWLTGQILQVDGGMSAIRLL